MRMFVIDYVYNNEVKTKLFDWHTEQTEAEKFCEGVKANGGSVNIRIRNIEIPN